MKKLIILITISLLSFNFTIDTTVFYGVVKYYNEDKGFGYILDLKSNDEVFFYDNDIIDEVNSSDSVKYNLINTRLGFNAKNIRLWKN